MKRLIVPVLLPVLVLAVSCEKNQNFQKIIEAPPTLVYVAEAGIDNVQKANVVVLPTGFVTTEKRFQVNVNSSLHDAATATLTVNSAELAAYNEKNGTSYPELPAANLSVTPYVRPAPLGEGEVAPEDPFSPSASATVHIDQDERLSNEFVRIRLGGDLASLTQPEYMVALSLDCPGMELSKKKNVYYLLVVVSEKKFKPIESLDEMTGTQVDAAVRRNFTADVDGYASLFDNNNNSYVNFDEHTGNVVTVDMQEPLKFSGISIRGYSYVYPTIEKIEISTDGSAFTDLGAFDEEDLYFTGTQCIVSLYMGMEARYVRLTFGMESQYWSYGYHVISEIYVYAEN